MSTFYCAAESSSGFWKLYFGQEVENEKKEEELKSMAQLSALDQACQTQTILRAAKASKTA